MPSLAVTLLIPLVIVLFAWRARFLTTDGCLAAFFVGAAVVDAGLTPTLQLLTFFFVSSALTKYKQKYKDALMPYYHHHHHHHHHHHQEANSANGTNGSASGNDSPSKRTNEKDLTATATGTDPVTVKSGRNYQQVLATGLVPAMCCLVRYVPLLPALSGHWYTLYFAFMCTNFGDTLASEVGMLSQQRPMLITHWHGRVAAGVDGGVTMSGTISSIIGGAVIGALDGSIHSLINGAVCGLCGSVIDSLMGALMQSSPARTGRLDNDGYALYEHRPMNYQWWEQSNAIVNFASASLTAALYIVWAHPVARPLTPLLTWSAAQLLAHLLYPGLARPTIRLASIAVSVIAALVWATSHPYQMGAACLLHVWVFLARGSAVSTH